MENKKLKLKKKLKHIMEGTKELAHGEETREWLLRINPKADWQLQIAALAHDIERAVPERIKREDYNTYDEYKANHAERSATIVEKAMIEEEFNLRDIKRVMNAIKRHEVGGDKDSDLVRDADSIRWFDRGHPNYIRAFGLNSAEEKGWWMYKRAGETTKRLIDTLPYDKRLKKFIQTLKVRGLKRRMLPIK